MRRIIFWVAGVSLLGLAIFAAVVLIRLLAPTRDVQADLQAVDHVTPMAPSPSLRRLILPNRGR